MRQDAMPRWLDDAVFYEIYPQSFKDSNADGIGDFQGIIEKLDYIKSLGCSALWLNPCFVSPFGDAGYDVANYYKAAPRYGTNEDLRRLFDEVHRRGMHILLDLVPGHTSVEHPWFKESMRPERNEFSDRYIWTDSIWKEPIGCASLRGISARDGSCGVNFFSMQPALNYGYYRPDPAEPWQQAIDAPGPQGTIAALKDIMRFWLKLGADGFRVDMAGSLVKCDEDGKGTIHVWQDIRRFLDAEFPGAVLISEWGEPDKSLAGGFHMDFLLHFGPSHYNDLFRCEHPFFAGNGDASAFVQKYKENYEKSGGNGLICIPSGNHDMERLAKYVSGDRAKIAFAFLLSMPGSPFIYYGDEIGMRYVENLTSVEGGYTRTGSRTPMQWDDGVNAGFSSAGADRLYIPQDSADDRPTVQAQLAQKGSLLNEVKKLIAIRRAHPALSNTARIEFLPVGKNSYPLAYIRSADGNGEKILVLLNPSEKEVTVDAPAECGDAIYVFGGEATFAGGKIRVPALSAIFYRMD